MIDTSSRLLRLTVQNFRGFRRSVELDFDANAVLLIGPNGTGKTSVFDALQWLLIGDVARLKSFTLRRNEEYLVNAFAEGVLARVEATFRVPDGELVARRTGSAQSCHLEVELADRRMAGTEAEVALRSHLAGGALALDELLTTTGLLQQDELRALLQTKPDQRYRQLLRLLGLESLERFESFAVARRQRLRGRVDTLQRDLTSLQRRTQEVREQIETAAQTPTLEPSNTNSRIRSAVLSQSPVLAEGTEADTAAAAEVAALAEQLADRLVNAHASIERMRIPESAMPASEVETLEVASAAAEGAQAVAAAAVEARRRDVEQAQSEQSAIGRLAAAALPYLQHQHETAACPVCETQINPELVVASLTARASSGARLAAAESALRDAESSFSDASANLERIRGELRVGQLRSEALQRFYNWARGVASEIDGVRKRAEAGIARIPLLEDNALDRLFSGDAGPERDAAAALVEWAEAREPLMRSLSTSASALREVSGAASSASAMDTAARIAHERSLALPRLRAQLVELETREAEALEAYELARRDAALAAQLATQAVSGSNEIFRARFDLLAPLMNDVYSRLDPHPAFTHLDFKVETYRARGTASAVVLDRQTEIEANPMIVFSSAQANCVVLAAFIALSLAARERGLPFVLLDDPLQAMDDVNVLGLADVARRVRRQKQMVLATHEERFGLLLQRKLTGRAEGEDLIVHRFVGWSRSGPSVLSHRVSPQLDVASLLAS